MSFGWHWLCCYHMHRTIRSLWAGPLSTPNWVPSLPLISPPQSHLKCKHVQDHTHKPPLRTWSSSLVANVSVTEPIIQLHKLETQRHPPPPSPPSLYPTHHVLPIYLWSSPSLHHHHLVPMPEPNQAAMPNSCPPQVLSPQWSQTNPFKHKLNYFTYTAGPPGEAPMFMASPRISAESFDSSETQPTSRYKKSNATPIFLRIKIEIHQKAGRALPGLGHPTQCLCYESPSSRSTDLLPQALEFPSPGLYTGRTPCLEHSLSISSPT